MINIREKRNIELLRTERSNETITTLRTTLRIKLMGERLTSRIDQSQRKKAEPKRVTKKVTTIEPNNRATKLEGKQRPSGS